MSLILDALNRSRDGTEVVPGLDTQHRGEYRRGKLPLILLGAALGLALVVIVGLLLDRGDRAAPDVQVAASPPAAEPQTNLPVPETETEPAPAPPVQSVPAHKSAAELKPVNAVSSSAPEAGRKAELAPATNLAVAALYADRAQQVKPAPDTGSESVPDPESTAPDTSSGQGNQARGEPQTREEPIDLEKMVQQAREELENTRLQEHPAPFINSLSQQTKDRIPTLFYERHDYSDSAPGSSVVLGGQRLQQGDRTGSGVRVDEILPDSVVLSYQGTQFRLRALNSWVNL